MTARYAQCDATCTADCGHCKGQGAPVSRTGATDREPVCAGLTLCVNALDRHGAGCPRGATDREVITRAMHEVELQPGGAGRVPWDRVLPQHRDAYWQMYLAARAAAAPDSGRREVVADAIRTAMSGTAPSVVPLLSSAGWLHLADAALLAEQPGGGR